MKPSRGIRLTPCALTLLLAACGSGSGSNNVDPSLVEQGKSIFRFDTFGDETQWTDTLRMHEVIASSVDPQTALSVGLKVDAEALQATRDVTNGNDDLVTDKLPALEAYQQSLEAPPPPAGSFDPLAAERGRLVFTGAGLCATCHSGPDFTDANERLHPPSEVVSEPEPGGAPSYASRTATGQYRTAPLKGIWQHPPYFHNGSAATLEAVVQTYNARKALGLSPDEIADLVEYLKSL